MQITRLKKIKKLGNGYLDSCHYNVFMKIEEIYNCRCTRKQTSSNYAEDKWEKNNNNKKTRKSRVKGMKNIDWHNTRLKEQQTC